MTSNQEKLINLAKKLVGVPYKYGAKITEAPEVFDCSGLIKYLYQQIGIDIPRSTIEQAEFAGREIKNIRGIQPGDLIFFKSSRGHYNSTFPKGVGHAVMYLGDNEVIHAKSKRVQHNPKIIEEGKVKIETFEEAMEELKPLVIIKRIIK